MTEARTNSTRRLAAILAADVVGYSRMMGADEAGTLAALKRHREELFDPAVAANAGRIVKLIGDGTLVEFASVVDAVKCALAIQTAAATSEGAPSITLRIGINLGDIIIDGDDIYGDGVNVAARLEPLAEPGGVCVSSIVNESVGTRVEVTFTDGGEVHVKNIDRPIRVWKWHPGSAPGAKATAPAEPKAELPSIAVLPFDNMSGDPEQEYFSDGISEDIITDLSKVAGLLVIARNSSFAYKGKSPDIRAVGRELGVGVVLEGSIRRAGNRVRITAQLIDATDGTHLWAERYDRDLTDIFEVQDEVTRTIVDALKIKLTPSEAARLAETPTTSVKAHDLFLRARELILSPTLTREKCEQGIALAEQAIAADPTYSQPYAGFAAALLFAYGNAWTDDLKATLKRAEELATKAIALDPNDAFSHWAYSICALFLGDDQGSWEATARALAINPNFPGALNGRGVLCLYAGHPEDGIPDIERAMRLDPGFSQQYLHFLGLCHFMLGHDETAATMFRERILLAPNTDMSRSALTSALGQLGEVDEARKVWAELKAINPTYDFEEHMARMPFRRPEDVQRLREGLAKAGLPG